MAVCQPATCGVASVQGTTAAARHSNVGSTDRRSFLAGRGCAVVVAGVGRGLVAGQPLARSQQSLHLQIGSWAASWRAWRARDLVQPAQHVTLRLPPGVSGSRNVMERVRALLGVWHKALTGVPLGL